jgi:hypothetical protein
VFLYAFIFIFISGVLAVRATLQMLSRALYYDFDWGDSMLSSIFAPASAATVYLCIVVLHHFFWRHKRLGDLKQAQSVCMHMNVCMHMHAAL